MRAMEVKPKHRGESTTNNCAVSASARQACGKDIPANVLISACESAGCCYDESTPRTTSSTSDGAEPACFRPAAKMSLADYYELNARTQVTTWATEDSGLHDYAYKLWAGLVSSFYVLRSKVGQVLCSGRKRNGNQEQARR